MDVFWHAFDAAGNILLQCVKAGLTILRSTEFISALAGAFFGVTGASWFESRRRRREKKDREYEAFLRTQAVIISQGNSLGWVAKDYPSEDSFDNLRTIVLGLTRQMVDFKDLAFIAKSSDPQLLIELDVANERYDFFRRLLESRNAAIEELLRHPEKDAAIREFLRLRETEDETFDAQLEQMMAEGPQLLLFKLRETNSAVPERLAKAKSANEETMKRLLSFAQREFPGRQVLSAHENASSFAPSPPVTGK
jgi:hypothetical protein